MAQDSQSSNKPPLPNRSPRSGKGFSPSAARNRAPLREVFLKLMPSRGRILEVGAGTGEHAVYIAGAAPGLSWHAGDPDPTARASIAAWIAEAGLPNLYGPHAVDVTAEDWGLEDDAPFDGVVSINMIHIAPFAAARGLFAGARKHLKSGGALFLYGPFSRHGVHTAPSNEAFDASLKARDAHWGVRDVENDLAPLAQKNALRLETVVEMPTNNLSLLFRKS
jgi:cyclopropane fatty-acyl-phospholipid synthase-like methyltransferase